MPYFKLYDCWGRCIVAFDETWQHAVSGHPELVGNEPIVMTSLVSPVALYQSDTNTSTRLYVGPDIEKGTFVGESPISVVEYKGTTKGVWKTGYFDSLMPKLKLLWSKR